MEEFVLALEPEAVYLAAQIAGEKEIRKLEQLMLICEETAADYILMVTTKISTNSLTLKKSYAPNCIRTEVTVPRRTPEDLADIVFYEDNKCQNLYLVVETKKEKISERQRKQAIEQMFGNANSLRIRNLTSTNVKQAAGECLDLCSPAAGIKQLYFIFSKNKDYILSYFFFHCLVAN